MSAAAAKPQENIMKFERVHFEVTCATKCNCADDELHKIAIAAVADLFGKDVAEKIASLKVREINDRWIAGWWDDRFSPSCASGDIGFYGDTPEDAVKAFLNYVLLGNGATSIEGEPI